MARTVVIALGGNAFIADDQHQSVLDQYRAAERACTHLVSLLRHDPSLRLVVTHGNGPQVGFILRRSEIAAGSEVDAQHPLHEVPLDSCVADTQGALGYHLVRALRNELRRQGLDRKVSALVTLVTVDRADPAFRNPSKPIGGFMSRERAEQHRLTDQWDVAPDRGGQWRRVVASPEPKAILELDAVKSLLDAGFVVVAGGGGGIAVVEQADGDLTGASAVIDKDLASSLLARQLGADLLIILTSVDRVCLNYGKPGQKALDSMTLREARPYIEEGHFERGSMLPKIRAVVQFLEGGGREAIITDFEHCTAALNGQCGTHVVA